MPQIADCARGGFEVVWDVIRRHVLWALAAGVAAGDDAVARAALHPIDRVLRWPARRRLERVLADAARSITDLGRDPEERRHVQRVAAIRLVGWRCDPQDRLRVAAAYAALPISPPPRRWIATLAVAVIALVAAGATVRAAWPRPPHVVIRHHARPLPPPAAGAFRDGGQPLTDPAVADVLARELTGLVIETDADRNTSGAVPDRLARTAALMEPAAITAHGPALATAWRDMVTMLDRWRRMPAGDRIFDQMSQALIAAVRRVSEQLAAVGLGYYLEANVLSGRDVAHAIVHGYRVEEVGFVTAAGKPRRVLGLRRLDRLNVAHRLLGMESEQLGDPVLLLDQIDAEVVSRTLPGLAPGLPYPLGDPAWAALAEARQVAAAAGEAVRGELVRQLDDDAGDAAVIAALLAERAAIFDRWRRELARRDVAFTEVDTLFVAGDLLARLDRLVPSAERTRVSEIEHELARHDASRIAAFIHELVADSVRRHEAQHGVDHERAPAPAAAGDAAGPDGACPELARSELSAYLSQIANDPVTPQFAYWHVVAFAFDRRTWGNAESYAGVWITAGIARHLGLAAADPLIRNREIDRHRLAVLARAIAGQPEAALRAAARATWQDQFGAPLATIVDRPPRDQVQNAQR
ncbi:MAG TPA: hypothetical protein VGD37_01080 [Kofleriaceae bacterium]|jgi:hypothetical protein